MSTSTPTLGLIADIGGTNARFALCESGGEVRDTLVLPCADYPGLAEAADAYLSRVGPGSRPSVGAFAVASPVTSDQVSMTNHHWLFSIDATRRTLGLKRLRVVNDFVAVAHCVPRLSDQHRVPIGRGEPMAGAPVAILGPGTGLGVALLVPSETGWRAIPTEGGHVTLAAADDEESAVLGVLRRRFGHVSAERVLSGPGLVNLRSALATLAGLEAPPLDPAQVTESALARSDSLSVRALDMFLAMLGTTAGNLALSSGAMGGVHIAGGILPRMIDTLRASAFRPRFEEKGRFRDYLGRIPTYLITHPYPAFPGLSGLLED
ncbi:MAG: glucokinase [Alphaproteobacteria bacterium]